MTQATTTVEILPPSSPTAALSTPETSPELAIRYHHAAQAAAAQAAHLAVLCGLELRRLQHQIQADAPWKEWVRQNLPFSYETARNYQRIAEGIKGRALATAQDPASMALLDLAPSQVTGKDREKLVQTVSKATDGKSLSQLYLDFGILKGDSRTNLRRGGATHHSGRKTEEQIEAEDAEATISDLMSSVSKWLAAGQHRLLDRTALQRLDQLLVSCREEIKPLL